MKEIERYKKHLKLIESIIKNKSCSNVPISFREDIYKIADSNGISYCKNCNTGLFSTIFHLHNLYQIELEKNKSKNVKRNKNT